MILQICLELIDKCLSINFKHKYIHARCLNTVSEPLSDYSESTLITIGIIIDNSKYRIIRGLFEILTITVMQENVYS